MSILAWEICLLFLRLAEVPLENPDAVNTLVGSLTTSSITGYLLDDE